MSSNRTDELIAVALDARNHAYAPYSKYRVGAALRTKAGKVFIGCNVENASYPVSLCAERNALGAAIAAGEREFDAMVIATGDPEPGAPCGMCRQALSELAPEAEVILVTPGGARKDTTVAALLPESFGPEKLVNR